MYFFFPWRHGWCWRFWPVSSSPCCSSHCHKGSHFISLESIESYSNWWRYTEVSGTLYLDQRNCMVEWLCCTSDKEKCVYFCHNLNIYLQTIVIWENWKVRCRSTVQPLSKLNATVTSNFPGGIAWLTNEHYKIFLISLMNRPIKTMQSTNLCVNCVENALCVQTHKVCTI